MHIATFNFYRFQTNELAGLFYVTDNKLHFYEHRIVLFISNQTVQIINIYRMKTKNVKCPII